MKIDKIDIKYSSLYSLENTEVVKETDITKATDLYEYAVKEFECRANLPNVSITFTKINSENIEKINKPEKQDAEKEKIKNEVNRLLNLYWQIDKKSADSVCIEVDYYSDDKKAYDRISFNYKGYSAKYKSVDKGIKLDAIDSSKFFSLSINEITNFQYLKFLEDKGDTAVINYKKWIHTEYPNCKITFDSLNNKFMLKGSFENIPVVHVTYLGAEEYAKSKNAKLPTENEWEWLASDKDVTGCRFSGSHNPDEVAVYYSNSNLKNLLPNKVGILNKPNKLGLNDMSGNVAEWTSSPSPSSSGKMRIKGGSYLSCEDDITIKSYREMTKESSSLDVGFRIYKPIK
ncbi:MAG: SUMF1/EgtB/PvdO family nonheme iron enzyme, partial [Bacteroidota bacterium]